MSVGREGREGVSEMLTHVMSSSRKELVEQVKTEGLNLEHALREKTSVLARIAAVEEDRIELQAQVLDLTKQKDMLATEKMEAVEVCDEFKDEADKTLEDYTQLAEDLKKVAEERDDYRIKKDKVMNTLSKRTEELQKMEKELEERDKENQHKCRTLESERDDAKNTLGVMSQQVRARARE